MSYSVTRVSRHELRYAEEDRVATLEVETGFDRPIDDPIGAEHLPFINLVVYVSQMRQWDNGEPMPNEDRQRIAQNISEALTTAGTKHVLA